MTEEFKLVGTWWVPKADGTKEEAFGDLTFSPDSEIILTLYQETSDFRAPIREAEFEFINGRTSEGKFVTLQSCRYAGAQLISTGIPALRYRASVVYTSSGTGALITNEDDTRFSYLQVEFTNMLDWARNSMFEIKTSYSKRYGISTTVKTKREPRQKLIEKDGTIVSLTSFLTSGPFAGWPTRGDVSLIQANAFIIESESPEPFSRHLSILRELQMFLAIALVHPVSIISIRAFFGKKRIDYMDIYYRQTRRRNDVAREADDNLLFSFPSIATNPDRYLNSWIGSSERLSSTLDAYFATMYAPFAYLEGQFLSYAQGCEGYGRVSFFPRNPGSPNLPSVLGKLIKPFKPLIIEKANVSKAGDFIEDVVHTRNFLSHRHADDLSRVRHGHELIQLTVTLKLLLELWILVEAGFTPVEAEDAVRQFYQILK